MLESSYIDYYYIGESPSGIQIQILNNKKVLICYTGQLETADSIPVTNKPPSAIRRRLNFIKFGTKYKEIDCTVLKE